MQLVVKTPTLRDAALTEYAKAGFSKEQVVELTTGPFIKVDGDEGVVVELRNAISEAFTNAIERMVKLAGQTITVDNKEYVLTEDMIRSVLEADEEQAKSLFFTGTSWANYQKSQAGLPDLTPTSTPSASASVALQDV